MPGGTHFSNRYSKEKYSFSFLQRRQSSQPVLYYNMKTSLSVSRMVISDEDDDGILMYAHIFIASPNRFIQKIDSQVKNMDSRFHTDGKRTGNLI